MRCETYYFSVVLLKLSVLVVGTTEAQICGHAGRMSELLVTKCDSVAVRSISDYYADNDASGAAVCAVQC